MHYELYTDPRYPFTMKKRSICVVGLGYIGLPLAHAFAEGGYTVLGFDINEKRIADLQSGNDWTGELTEEQLANVSIEYSSDPSVIAKAQFIIMAIPTPIDTENNPDLTMMKTATTTVGRYMQKGVIVVYESTVAPGTTEDICGPILEAESGLKCGEEFTLGYSPERINPGDKEHIVTKLTKVVAGQDEKTTQTLIELYASVITAGVHHAPSIKVAEMGKAIENAQRDLNIAFINEVAMICDKLNIETTDVLNAAGTKWNFLRFEPGLVGGHCIGVDPYYLVQKAKDIGIESQVITAGRGVNDGMPEVVAHQIHEAICECHPEHSRRTTRSNGARIIVLGLTFKPDVPDTRNSKSGDVVRALESLGHTVSLHDPYLPSEEIEAKGYTPGALEDGAYDAVVLLVPHKEYLSDEQAIINTTKDGGLIYDMKSALDREEVEGSGRRYKAL